MLDMAIMFIFSALGLYTLGIWPVPMILGVILGGSR